MAWYREMKADLAPGCADDAEFLSPCEHDLLEVCRKAEEVERG
jgi:hypothetical protein